jgi:hypothetical protein
MYNPPPNPAKITDSRCQGYINIYGKTSWELDALPPDVLEELIENRVSEYLDEDEWEIVENEIRHEKQQLSALCKNWDKVCQYKFMRDVN